MLAGGFLLTGTDSWFPSVSLIGSFTSQWLLLAFCGYLSHYKAPSPRILFSVLTFAINAFLYYFFTLTFLLPLMEWIYLESETKPSEFIFKELVANPVTIIEALIPFALGAVVSSLLFAFKYLRLTRKPFIQRVLLILFGAGARFFAIGIIIFSCTAFLVTTLPEAIGYLFPPLAPNSAGAFIRTTSTFRDPMSMVYSTLIIFFSL